MYRNEEEWLDLYKKHKKYFKHDFNPLRPHPILTSEMHSSGFANSRFIVEDDTFLYEAASDLVELYQLYGNDLRYVDCVVGPQTGATRLAKAIADTINEQSRERTVPCRSASPKKIGEGQTKQMVLDGEYGTVERGDHVLLCEDVITTGGSAELTALVCREAGGIVLPSILALFNRSSLTEADGRIIVPLIHRSLPTWPAEECLLCPLGSEGIRPKGDEAWIQLTGDY